MLDAVSSLSPAGMGNMDFLAALAPRAAINGSANIAAAAEDFEAMFATQLLKPMFDTVPVNGLFGGGNGEEIMRSFLLQEYGKTIAKTGCLGIAPQVKNEMLRAQENAKGRKSPPAPAKPAAASLNARTKGAAYASAR